MFLHLNIVHNGKVHDGVLSAAAEPMGAWGHFAPPQTISCPPFSPQVFPLKCSNLQYLYVCMCLNLSYFVLFQHFVLFHFRALNFLQFHTIRNNLSFKTAYYLSAFSAQNAYILRHASLALFTFAPPPKIYLPPKKFRCWCRHCLSVK